MCFPEVPVQGKFVAARWAKIISSIFIVFTMAVYFFLPEMLNLFGKILMSYCVAMLAIFIFLIYAQFKTTDVSDAACLRDSKNENYQNVSILTLFVCRFFVFVSVVDFFLVAECHVFRHLVDFWVR